MTSIKCIFLLLCPFVTHLQAQNPAPDSIKKVQWLKENVIKVQSVDPEDENFSDLRKLEKWIGNAQVVSIGEPSHYIGTVLHAKTRLIKFLHQKMGFEVIAFEQSMYDMTKAWKQIQVGNNPYKAYKDHQVLLNIFDEYLPLFNYIKSKVHSSQPLEITGFDSQLGGYFYKDSLFSDLQGFFSNLGYNSKQLSDTQFVKEFFSSNRRDGLRTNNVDLVLKELSLLSKVLDSLAPRPLNKEAGFYKQLLRSISKNIEQVSLAKAMELLSGAAHNRAATLEFTIRDEQMADNLLWLVKQNPGRKIIVIAHNSHLVKDYPGDRTKQRWNDKPDAPPAPKALFEENYFGYIIADSLKEKQFNIAFTIGEGKIGYIYTKDSTRTYTWNIPRSNRQNVLENYLDAAGLPNAIVNLKQPGKGGEWLQDNIRIRYYTGPGSRYQWSKAADAIFYVRDATPVYVK